MITAVLIVLISSLLPVKLYIFFRGKQFGGRIRQHHLEKYRQSPNWDGKKFNNLEETTMDVNLGTLPSLMKKQLRGRSTRGPKQSIPILPFTKDVFVEGGADVLQFIWLGHSVLLLHIGGKTLLIDPMLGPDASPIAPIASKRFSVEVLDLIDHLPDLDAILLTHDHYDHLDYGSITRLKDKTSRFFVALGVGRHLVQWGISQGHITEFDWWDRIHLDSLEIVFTPSRHFSGRGPLDRAQSLWGGWVFIHSDHRVYWSGDGGYGTHFQEVGTKFGPFDWAFVECGQYNEMWHQIHMYPEESIQAARDAQARVAIPVHWGGFSLAMHHWQDPIDRFVKEAQRQEQEFCCPMPGQLVSLGVSVQNPWWKDY